MMGVLEQTVLPALGTLARELTSMFCPLVFSAARIKRGESYKDLLNRPGDLQLIKSLFGWGHVQIIALIIREHIFSKAAR